MEENYVKTISEKHNEMVLEATPIEEEYEDEEGVEAEEDDKPRTRVKEKQ